MSKPDWSLVHDPLDEQAESYSERTAYIFEDVEYTYAEFADRTRRAAAGLSALGVDQGSVVGAHARNHVDLFTTFYACSRIGAVFSPFSTHRSADELEFMAAALEPTVLVYTTDEAVESGRRRLRSAIPDTYLVSLDGTEVADDMRFETLLERDQAVSDAAVNPTDFHNVFWTSGTTGQPKGVVRNHQDSLGYLAPAIGTVPFQSGGVRLLPRHMMYVAAYLQYGIPAIMHGETTVILRSFSVDGVIQATSKFDVYVSSLGFTPAKRVLDHLERIDESIDIEISHTVLPSREFAVRLLDRVHDDIWHVYSTTEVGGPFVVYFDPEKDDNDPPVVGSPPNGVETRLVRAEPTEAVPPDDIVSGDGPGELIVRGVTTMTRYLSDAVQRERVRDGWVYTGDLFRRTPSGAYQYLGRVDNRIRSGGVNVYPEPMERVLAGHDDVTDAVVVGVPDAEWGERVAALVVVSDADRDASVLADELDEFARSSEMISRQLRPRSYRVVDSIDDIPSGGRGKYDRKEIAAMFD